MHLRNTPALAVALLLVAGCLGNAPDASTTTSTAPAAPTQVELSEATYTVGQFLSAKVPAKDGANLHIDVTLPSGDGPFPTILLYTPYSILGAELDAAMAEHPEIFGPVPSSYYVERGYATATAHVRGTGESEGCLTIGDPIEGEDGYALVEWIAAQDWSSGKVAIMGTSYDGTTPLETAVWQPPHLTTIVPISPVTEWYLYYFENGLHRNNADPPPGSSNTDPALWAVIGAAPGPRTGASGGVADVTCQTDFAQQHSVNDDYNAYWKARDHHAQAGKITVPVLFAHGWQDGNVAATGIESLWTNISAEKRLWVQQHGHGVPSAKTGYHEYVHRWLDYWLLGRDNGALLLPQVILEDNLGEYRAEPAWPPADQDWLRLNLTSGGLGGSGSADGATAITLQDLGAPANQEAVDLATFVSTPLDGPQHIAGTPTVQLRIASNLPTGQVALNLHDDAPDGSSVLVSRAFMDLRHRDSLAVGSDLTPGSAYDVAWSMHPNDHRIEKGHWLRLTVSTNDGYVRANLLRPTLTLDVADGASWIALPLVSDDARTYASAPPAPWEDLVK